jgi:LmbE family N-acetylglucosaminyl deacetylase
MAQSLKDLFGGWRPLALPSLEIPSALRLAVLAPHPDDFDAIGMALHFFQQNGNTIELAVLSSGASGVEDGFGGAFTAGEKAALRENEQRASCFFFGLPESRLNFLRLSEDDQGHPADNPGNLALVRNYLLARQPDMVFLPHGNDTNPGHQRTYAFLRRVIEEAKWTLVACLNRDPKTIAMRPDLFFPFGAEEAEWKGQLLRFHQSQHQRNWNTRRHGFDVRILEVNRQIADGLVIPASYAEVFELEFYGSTGSDG